MTSPSLPDNWRSLVAGYVLNDLTPDEGALVDQWLTQYPEVAVELETLQTTWESLPAVLPPVLPPAALRDRIFTAVQAPATDPPFPLASAPAPVPRRPLPWGRWALGLGWAATALALMLTWQENQRLRLALRQTEAVVASFSQPANQLYTLTGTGAQPQANARLVVNPAAQTALIVTTDLPPLTADQVYRLWALADSDPVFCGEFNPSAGQDTNQWALPDTACAAAPVQMLITTERAADPPVPAGDLVMEGRS